MRDAQNSRKGQSLVEFCLLIPSLMTSLALVLFTGLKSILPFLLSLDLYDLARAHLYGVEQSVCEPSSLWPRALIEVHFDCSAMPRLYVAEAFLKWNEMQWPLARVASSLWGAQ
jgi:hypothetical protein